MENYMFLYLKTGGGHLAPARAIAEVIKEKNQQVEVHLIDGLAEANPVYRHSIEEGYRQSVNNAPWSYTLVYAFHKLRPVSKMALDMANYFTHEYIERKILEIQPTKIVVFHFLLIKPVQDIVTRHKLNASVHVVVTDPFTAHPMWFMQPGVQYIVFSQSLKDSCVQAGINEQLIKVFPFVINEKFTRGFTDFEKSCAKIKLGFSLHKKVVLIMGGGDGMPRGRDIVKNLTACNIDAEIAIVCGKNKRLFDKCHELKIKHKLVNLKIYGFVDFVHTLIGISDVVITKCGASTFMEIITMGKVPVINNFIWEQEKGNMEYVCHNNMGIYEKNTRRLPRVLQSVLTDEKLYETYRQNITRLLPVNGTRLVSEYLLDIQH